MPAAGYVTSGWRPNRRSNREGVVALIESPLGRSFGWIRRTKGGAEMAVDRRKGGRFAGGIGVGGILVIVGIVVAVFWSLVLGIIIALVGLIAFGGFVSGKWY
jgi:hypothetical protein